MCKEPGISTSGCAAWWAYLKCLLSEVVCGWAVQYKQQGCVRETQPDTLRGRLDLKPVGPPRQTCWLDGYMMTR